MISEQTFNMSGYNQLIFPDIIFDEKITDRSGERNIYRVDCSRMPGSIPPQYQDLIDNARFALNHDYISWVIRLSREALNFWQESKPFDTCVRDRILQVAIKKINTAFYLLTDCLYNMEGKSFERGQNRLIILFLLKYHFWDMQTGSAIVLTHSDITDTLQMNSQLIKEAESLDELPLPSDLQVLLEISNFHTEVEEFTLQPARPFVGDLDESTKISLYYPPIQVFRGVLGQKTLYKIAEAKKRKVWYDGEEYHYPKRIQVEYDFAKKLIEAYRDSMKTIFSLETQKDSILGMRLFPTKDLGQLFEVCEGPNDPSATKERKKLNQSIR